MIIIGVGVLVVSRSQLDQEIDSVRREIQVAVDQGNWSAAQVAIEEMDARCGWQ